MISETSITASLRLITFAAILALGVSLPARADTVATVTIEKVMTGPSFNVAGGNDQVWLRVAGQPANIPVDCTWTSYSLFYLPDDTVLNRDRALAVLLSAKAANQPITITFDVGANYADFGGFGYTKCILRKVTFG